MRWTPTAKTSWSTGVFGQSVRMHFANVDSAPPSAVFSKPTAAGFRNLRADPRQSSYEFLRSAVAIEFPESAAIAVKARVSDERQPSALLSDFGMPVFAFADH
jgi:hypothetical protein